jgi:chemotaxis signal transduction protein
MSTSDAWLLECGETLSIAVGDHEMVELLQTESCHHVPGAPPYCSDVLQWHENMVPIMDIEVLHDNAGRERSASYLCLLNYQEALDRPLQQLALRVDRAPERIQVDDAQVCELPGDYDDSPLKPVILSCFTYHAKPVLILDISSLCSDEFRDLASPG